MICSRFHNLFRYDFIRILQRGPNQIKRSITSTEVPIPKLNQTLTYYLKSTRPFLSANEFEKTETIVRNFEENEGEILQNYLEERVKNSELWREKWLHHPYLEFYRDIDITFTNAPVINSIKSFKNENERLEYAAKVILGTLDYKISSKQKPESSYIESFYGSCRVPKPDGEEIKFVPNSSNIVVIKNNNFFSLEVVTPDNIPISFNCILDQLKFINEESHERGNSIGVLTFDQRTENYHKLLSKDEKNHALLKEIEESLFVVSLDKNVDKKKDNILTVAAKQCLHGGGLEDNVANRWFDKTIQISIGMDGYMGVSTFEHSPIVGQPTSFLLDHIVNYVESDESNKFSGKTTAKTPRRMNFNIDDELKTAIEKVSHTYKEYTENLDMNLLKFTEFGKDFIKSQKLSPNSFIQVALQYAYYRIHEKPCAQFETIGTVRGTPETMRACSNETLSFCKKMLNEKNSTKSEMIEALKNAVNTHKESSTYAAKNIGIDRHLLGLRLAAQELGKNIPKLFQDVAFVRSSRDHIISSQNFTKNEGAMCYAPGVLDGYGCCYNPREKDLIFAISCFKESKKTASSFKGSLEESLIEIFKLLA